MTIKDLGRWESLEMVQRYTRSVTFEDSMKHYKAPLRYSTALNNTTRNPRSQIGYEGASENDS